MREVSWADTAHGMFVVGSDTNPCEKSNPIVIRRVG